MGYREVSVVQVKEILRLWVRGHRVRAIARRTQTDRKTVGRYITAAAAAGLAPDRGEGAITDDLVGAVVEAVRPARAFGRGRAWHGLEGEREFLEKHVEDGVRLTKVHELLERRGIAVPYRTLHRFCATELGYGRRRATVPVTDCDPGEELQVDFGRMGLVPDPPSGRQRICHALVFTAVYSRYMFVFLTFAQTLDVVIEAFEAAWQFFGGCFRVVIQSVDEVSKSKQVGTYLGRYGKVLVTNYREFPRPRRGRDALTHQPAREGATHGERLFGAHRIWRAEGSVRVGLRR